MRPARLAVCLSWVAVTALLALPRAAFPEKRTRLDLRALPRVASAPATVLFNVDLSGVEDSEAFYCPALDWEWGDGTKSTQDDECPPFEPGRTQVQRHFTASHEYRDRVRARVTVALRKGDRVLARANVNLIIGEPKKPLDATIGKTGGD